MLEVFEHLGVKKYSLIGGMYDMVPHTRPLLVSGVGVGSGVEEENRLVKVRTSNYEGPTTITYMIGQGVAQRGGETRIYVVHLPQYFQLEEDFTGTARLMEILCTLYKLPERLIEADRGGNSTNPCVIWLMASPEFPVFCSVSKSGTMRSSGNPAVPPARWLLTLRSSCWTWIRDLVHPTLKHTP